VFVFCDLEGVSFEKSDLHEAIFERCNLRKTNFKDAQIGGGGFKDSKIEETLLDVNGFIDYGSSQGFKLE
jgi:uncharacterized protein YjbI with pentapeptide repeats